MRRAHTHKQIFDFQPPGGVLAGFLSTSPVHRDGVHDGVREALDVHCWLYSNEEYTVQRETKTFGEEPKIVAIQLYKVSVWRWLDRFERIEFLAPSLLKQNAGKFTKLAILNETTWSVWHKRIRSLNLCLSYHLILKLVQLFCKHFKIVTMAYCSLLNCSIAYELNHPESEFQAEQSAKSAWCVHRVESVLLIMIHNDRR